MPPPPLIHNNFYYFLYVYNTKQDSFRLTRLTRVGSVKYSSWMLMGVAWNSLMALFSRALYGKQELAGVRTGVGAGGAGGPAMGTGLDGGGASVGAEGSAGAELLDIKVKLLTPRSKLRPQTSEGVGLNPGKSWLIARWVLVYLATGVTLTALGLSVVSISLAGVAISFSGTLSSTLGIMVNSEGGRRVGGCAELALELACSTGGRFSGSMGMFSLSSGAPGSSVTAVKAAGASASPMELPLLKKLGR